MRKAHNPKSLKEMLPSTVEDSGAGSMPEPANCNACHLQIATTTFRDRKGCGWISATPRSPLPLANSDRTENDAYEAQD
ncbi:hypothetical protein JZ751_005269 [Albula glossodonta]|uniref:Uncharacterized protein n=1 Tax=Albula glossodonta TaxID=121402 RepID=A0A8T2P569_9TELE|nr:hypothetical protein JZ751_005269 [Albula glossodonta]